jgi:hypothetical protein
VRIRRNLEGSAVKLNFDKATVALAILIVSAVGYFPYQLLAVKMFSERLTIKVVENDAATECSSKMRRLIGGRYRSDIPKFAGFGYCGIITSDHGGFKLPEPSLGWRLGVEDRASIDRKLTDGDCFEVLVYGFGKTPMRGDAIANRGNWEIVSVVGDGDCPA